MIRKRETQITDTSNERRVITTYTRHLKKKIREYLKQLYDNK